MSSLAIIGSGIAGLGLAYYLRGASTHLTVFEKDSWLGGHANTVSVSERVGHAIPIDTGFMVFNHVTYPLLTALFSELEVATEKTDMSFSVQHKLSKLEYSGASFNRLFGDRRNIFSPRFWCMLREIERFNRDGHEALDEGAIDGSLCLADYAKARGYSHDLVEFYLVPMGASLWSTPPDKMMKFPAVTLLRFFKNHGLLGVDSHHQWWTVKGGSRQYVSKLVQRLGSVPRVSSEVVEVRRNRNGVSVITVDGRTNNFDQVVLACHADQALRLLAEPTEDEVRLLSAFSYQRNDTLLHTDDNVMPSQKRCWASWNYRIDQMGSSTHYWMNSLQNVSEKLNYFVTLNGRHLVDSERVIKRLVYHHPIFDLPALGAQTELPVLNERSDGRVFFCGSYFGYGFHEDALRSAHQLARVMTGEVLCK